MRVYGDWLAFGICLKWLCQELQFLAHLWLFRGYFQLESLLKPIYSCIKNY